ncbi:MAG: peptidase P60 [Arcobacter sp.]|nr:peptidase P60 [Arcobacter sp.]
MKKEIAVILTAITLFTGCEQYNQPQTPTNKGKEEAKVSELETNDSLNMKNELMSFYSEWKGTRYKAGGKTKKGIDSAALTQIIYDEKFNLKVPRKAYKQAKSGLKIEKENLEMGDIIVFKRKKEFYTGVYLDNNKFMHSSFKGVTIDNLNKSPYKYIYYTARRIF